MQQLTLFETGRAAPPPKKPWSIYGVKRDRVLNRLWNYNLDETWQPQVGDVVSYQERERGSAMVDGAQWFVGWHTLAYVLEVAGEVVLLYFPAGARYDWKREWIGAGAVANCWPETPQHVANFLKHPINPIVTDIYPAVAARRAAMLELVEPPKDLFDEKNHRNTAKSAGRKRTESKSA